MSYEIIRSIKIKDNKVFVRAISNNVYPKDYSEEEAPYLTRILQQQGKEALDISIMEAYEGGTFQRGSNKYTRALKVLRHFSEYPLYDWRGDNEKRRNTPEFKALLLKALKTKLPKDQYIISKDYFGKKVYFWRQSKWQCKWTYEKEKAKIFHYEVEAINTKHNFQNSENWIIEKIK